MTETSAVITVRHALDPNIGNVGPPLPHCEIKLQDVPEMKYLHTDNPPRGEILCRGPGIFKGYFKNKEQTDEVLQPDGWMHTGDIGI